MKKSGIMQVKFHEALTVVPPKKELQVPVSNEVGCAPEKVPLAGYHTQAVQSIGCL
jgi:hypothetical protein